ncbi:hypothetical protein [Clostridium ljungdahlii]|uniref:Uncharacterized protein n=2 Tax=Clostridium ljungdahlii TaxID=1538 RepID=D8GU61_CLOLD|nr:hypothetical protein [Clostridium ljungdahlii]ADK14724.1 hypothetical protein CLJU_c16600 [Clostridium ljungdahlii DSM 13528]OAA84080.1 hypothetical protein WX45_01924 [Clostridium ljungdahlii DSM 13528]
MNVVMNKVREYAENEKNEFKDIKVYEATQKVQAEINRKELKKQLKKFEGKDVMIDLIGEVSIPLFMDGLEIGEFKDIKGNYRMELSSIDEKPYTFIDVEDVYCIYENPLLGGVSIFFRSGTEMDITVNK